MSADGRRQARGRRDVVPSVYPKLKPRRGHAGKQVVDHQLGRMYAATIDLVAADGYGSLTVAGITRFAGLSKRTFYEHFDDKDDCFLATYDVIVRHVARTVLVAQRDEADWEGELRAGFVAFAREVAERPKAARLALVEIFAAGGGALGRMRHTEGLFEAVIAQSFSRSDDGVELPSLLIKGIVAGGMRVARARLLSGQERELVGDAGALMQWALCLRHPVAAETCTPPVVTRAVAHNTLEPPAPELVVADPGELLDAERRMILGVVIVLVAREGYGALSVRAIRRAAGISRRCFERHFDGVEDCFLAAVELLAGRAIAAARRAFLSTPDWPRAIQRALAAICAHIVGDPALVRLAFFEVFATGGDAVRWRNGYISALAALLRGTAPADRQPSELAAEASVGAVWALLHHYATTGRAERMGELVQIGSYIVLAPAIGPEAAGEAIRTEAAQQAGHASTTACRSARDR